MVPKRTPERANKMIPKKNPKKKNKNDAKKGPKCPPTNKKHRREHHPRQGRGAAFSSDVHLWGDIWASFLASVLVHFLAPFGASFLIAFWVQFVIPFGVPFWVPKIPTILLLWCIKISIDPKIVLKPIQTLNNSPNHIKTYRS